jgi:molybdate transport system ATP-binding protein
VLVSHDFLDALTLGDRIAVLEEGRISQCGPREEVLRRPRTPFLAELTGHNVLAGLAGLAAGDSGLREVQVGPLVLHVAEAGAVPAGPVFVAFGPQEVTLAPAAMKTSARNQFRAVVGEIVPLPDRLRVYLQVADAGVPLMADVVRESVAALHLEPGAEVVAAVKATSIELYA